MKRFRPGATFGDFIIHDSAVKKSKVGDAIEVNYRKGWLVWMVVLVLFGILGVRLIALQLFYGERYRKLSDENRIKTIRLAAARGGIFDRNGVLIAGNIKNGDKWLRGYPLREAAAHVLGYESQVNAEEVGLLKTLGDQYQAGDMVGRTGLEAVYETYLRGKNGGRLVEVDNQGQEVRELGRREAIPGTSLKMALDANLLTIAYQSLASKKGAVVASNPQNGEILALVSAPSYDPNLIATQYGALSIQEGMPFLNRAIGAIYPPGSTFKMVTTTAAISEGKVKSDFTFTDEGIIRVGDFSYSNWLYSKGGGVEGNIGFARAIQRSTDTFFYKVGELTTPEIMAKWAKLLGMGQKTGIDLPGEVEGLIPDPTWKKAVKNEDWFLGNTYHMAIGQGDVLVTPLQVNQMTNVMATGGKKCKLHVAMYDTSPLHPSPNLGEGNFRDGCPVVPVDPEAIKLIHQGMIGACSSGGTAFPIFDWNDAAKSNLGVSAYAKAEAGKTLPVIGCKTGTAEYMAADGKMRTHGWLTAYAPADNPTISVTVVIEGGGEGSNVAAPVVRQVLAKYFGVTDTYPYKNIPQEVSE